MTTPPATPVHPHEPDDPHEVARKAVAASGVTYARQAGVTLADTPSALYRLMVLTVLLANRLPADAAVGAARALFRAGLRTPGSMVASSWQERGDLLAANGYRRLAGRGATVLGDGAAVVADSWGSDLRRLRAEGAGSVSTVRRSLERVPGIGHVGSAIFCREVQGVWPDISPFADERVLAGARALGLPGSPHDLAALVEPTDLVRLVAACVRASFAVRERAAVASEAVTSTPGDDRAHR